MPVACVELDGEGWVDNRSRDVPAKQQKLARQFSARTSCQQCLPYFYSFQGIISHVNDHIRSTTHQQRIVGLPILTGMESDSVSSSLARSAPQPRSSNRPVRSSANKPGGKRKSGGSETPSENSENTEEFTDESENEDDLFEIPERPGGRFGDGGGFGNGGGSGSGGGFGSNEGVGQLLHGMGY